ncbi:hypothetical protein EV2_011022 [Malus domestica]
MPSVNQVPLREHKRQCMMLPHQVPRRDASNCSILLAISCFPQLFNPSATKSKHRDIGINPISDISTK